MFEFIIAGILSPFAKIDGLYFDGSDEPFDFYYNLVQDLKAYYKEHGKKYITFSFDDKKEFYKMLYALEQFTNDNIMAYGTSREGQMEMVIEEEVDIDATTKQITNHADEESKAKEAEASKEPKKKTKKKKDE